MADLMAPQGVRSPPLRVSLVKPHNWIHRIFISKYAEAPDDVCNNVSCAEDFKQTLVADAVPAVANGPVSGADWVSAPAAYFLRHCVILKTFSSLLGFHFPHL